MAGETVIISTLLIIFLAFIIGFIILGVIILAFVFWILMIVDCAKRKFKEEGEKIVWILILIFLHILGAIIYYFAVKRENRN